MDENDSLLGDEDDWAMLHYAAGILLGLGRKYGAVDVTIYYDSVRIRIEPVKQQTTDLREHPLVEERAPPDPRSMYQMGEGDDDVEKG